ncbi:restriction endonuclease subunit S [Anoxybacillus rupiensis]|jgi:type I restriction enzyme, S subunit|uniref:Restriction endonuclease subunit S n=1 Tax=Anoxybacteroides rupiense TaxID=311460 RepID=A0ABT5W927_9BACL|nr:MULTISPECIES: restriction endonuclease subunit S [Anoxybacillus]MDE8565707.1 restriction endonuclease subunit S [Anoxybacillus rupiensis]QHC03325.1 restriction endonuclease subunit S [Anoxybacillus sp. PDR2]
MSKTKQKSIDELLEEALVPEDEQPYEVPGNWVWTKAGDITEIVGGGTPKTTIKEYYENGNVPWITPADLSDFEDIYIGRGQRNITEEGLKNSSAKLLPEKTVLLSSRAPIGYVAIAANPLSTNQGFKSFIPSNSIDSEYLYWYLKGSRKYLESMGSGSTFKEISASKCKEIKIPLPPINEQKRIAEKVERLFAKIDEAKRLIEEVKESFELRRAAILEKAFKGQLGTNDLNEKSMLEISDVITENDLIPEEEQLYELPKNWVWVKIGAVFRQVNEQILPNGDETYVGLEHLIKGGGISHTELAKDVKSKKVVFKVGDVLYGKLRPYLNKHAVVDFDGVASTDILVFRTKYKHLNRILDYYLGLPSTIEYAISNSNGINLPRVSPKKMNELPFPLPPKNEWERIVKILDKLFSDLNEEQILLDCLEEELVSLKSSILNKAFRSELGTNDPNDEHAIELLKGVLRFK